MTTNPAISFLTSAYSTSEGHPFRYENLQTLLEKQDCNVRKAPKSGKKSKKFKRIVICCDGTWQKSDGPDKAPPSNVTRIARSIKSYAKKDKIQQIVYYQRGVGTSGKIDKILGGQFANLQVPLPRWSTCVFVDIEGRGGKKGGTGVGLDDNIRVAYGFIAHNYHKKDEIFLIGFSRGAYTVRSVCGLISTIGVLTKKGMNDFADIWKTYTSKEGFTPEGIQELWDRGKKVVTPAPKVCIKAIGCWDTVGALGVPSLEIKIPFYGTKIVNTVDTGHKKIGFHDVELSDTIENAFHALALDENRSPFTPTLWRRQSGSKTNLKQVWFPGVHSNIGGGYENQEIADITLGWMIQNLSPFLEFSKSNLLELLQNDVYDEAGKANPHLQWAGGKIEDSSNTILMWLMSGVHRTPGGYLHHQDIKKGIRTEESMHRSVSIRYAMDPSWRPKGLEGWTYDEEQGLWENKAESKELLEDHLGEVEKQLAGQWVLENMCGEKWTGKWLGRW